MAGIEEQETRFSAITSAARQWGQHAVCETLRSSKWPILEIHVTQKAFDQHGLIDPAFAFKAS